MDDVTLSAGALSSLTDRIKAGLKSGKGKDGSSKKGKAKPGSKGSIDHAKDKAATNGSANNGKKSGKQHESRSKNGLKAAKVKTEETGKGKLDTPKASHANGKKRLRDGQLKEDKHKPSKSAGAQQDIRDVVMELGEEDDLDLINGIESGSEMEGDVGTDSKTLGKELKKMIKDMGISKAAVGDIEEVSEAEVEDVETEAENSNMVAVQSRDRKAVSASAKSRSGLSFEPRGEWHTAFVPPTADLQDVKSLPEDAVNRLHDYAKELLQKEGDAYTAANKSASSAHQFYSTIMTSGTLSDKISALTLSVQESPLHNQRALDTLVGLAKKRSRGQAIEVLTALKDLLGPGSLLPSNRKLYYFSSQPGLYALSTNELKNWNQDRGLPMPLTKAHLLYWAFEDYLKTIFFEILKVVETWCNDEIVFARTKALDIVFELLRDKPEQEANLLRLLVNKLGDTEKKIASRASYNLLQLQIPHPMMKSTIISAIEADVLFKPGQSMHAKYYAIITLNQTVLSSKEDAVVRKVLHIYFSLFMLLLSKPQTEPLEPQIATVNKKGQRQGGGSKPGKMAIKKQKSQASSATPEDDIRERTMSAVLTGINRAIPYTDVNDEFFEKHLDTLFKITHSSNFNTSIQALMLIQQLCGNHQAASDRFYRTLYESLLDPRLLTTSKQLLYLNLLYRALRADLNVKRVKAFEKRLLQVISMHQPPFACAVLYLLRELEGVFPNLTSFIDDPEEGAEDADERYQDVSEDEAVDPVRKENLPTRAPRSQYDGRKRAPEYSNADQSCLWEIGAFAEHYHPSVSLFASRLLEHGPMPPKPTLDAHTLKQFLDRFVYRNAKKVTGKMHGSSIMQPLAGGDKSSLLVTARSSRDKLPVNSDAFYKMSGDKVDADDAFFHKYFNVKARGKGLAKTKKEKKQATNAGSEASQEDEDEDEIWQALVDSRPEVEGSLGDDDLDMDDFSDFEDFEDEDDAVVEGGDKVEDGSSDAGVALDDQMDEGDSEGLDFEDEEGALLDSDDELPSDIDEAFNKELQMASGDEPKSSIDTKGKEKRGDKRRRLKSLPTFASADDYAALLEEHDNDEDM